MVQLLESCTDGSICVLQKLLMAHLSLFMSITSSVPPAESASPESVWLHFPAALISIFHHRALTGWFIRGIKLSQRCKLMLWSVTRRAHE